MEGLNQLIIYLQNNNASQKDLEEKMGIQFFNFQDFEEKEESANLDFSLSLPKFSQIDLSLVTMNW